MASRPLSDTWEQGDPYEQYVGRWSRRVATRFLAWLNVGPGRRWLEVGCGTGALSTAILDGCSPSSLVGIEPSEGFLETTRSALGDRMTLRRGTAADIPVETDSVDITVCGLVLNFVPDPRAALREMARVTVADGIVAAYVWDYAEGMELMRRFWDAAADLYPEAATHDEGRRFPWCRPDGLHEVFTNAGLAAIEVTAIDIATKFTTFDDYWRPFLGGQGPAPAYAMALDEAARARLRERLRARLPRQPDGSIALNARAWAVRGTVRR